MEIRRHPMDPGSPSGVEWKWSKSSIFNLQFQGAFMRDRITPLLTEAQIRARVQEMGAQLTRDYAGQDLVVVGLLNGVFPFFADLVRSMDFDFDVSFMQVASYGGGTESTGEVHILKDLDRSIQGRHALVVEDIVDTGLTLFKVRNLLKDREPQSLKICTLLDKPSRRKIEVPVDYVGFTIEDHFVVGYGLDFDGKLRNLPYVGVYHP
jgi:hypoxanthine phosphoribosyltransferase